MTFFIPIIVAYAAGFALGYWTRNGGNDDAQF